MNKSVLVIPGSFSLSSAPALGGYPAMDIWLKNHKKITLDNVDWLVGHSLGASYILSQNILPNQKIILVNPLIIRRNFLSLLIRDIRFLVFERVSPIDLIPLSDWLYGVKMIFKLLKINVLENLKKLPKNKVFVIRGLKDSYFCDSENVALAKNEGFTVFEVEAGHLGNNAVNQKIEEIIRN